MSCASVTPSNQLEQVLLQLIAVMTTSLNQLRSLNHNMLNLTTITMVMILTLAMIQIPLRCEAAAAAAAAAPAAAATAVCNTYILSLDHMHKTGV